MHNISNLFYFGTTLCNVLDGILNFKNRTSIGRMAAHCTFIRRYFFVIGTETEL